MAEQKKDDRKSLSKQEKQELREKKRQQREFLDFYGLSSEKKIFGSSKQKDGESKTKTQGQQADDHPHRESAPAKTDRKSKDGEKPEAILNFFGLFLPSDSKGDKKASGKVPKRNNALYTSVRGKEDIQHVLQVPRTVSHDAEAFYSSKNQRFADQAFKNTNKAGFPICYLKKPSDGKGLNIPHIDEPSSLIESVSSEFSKTTEKILVTNVPIQIVKKKPGETAQSQNLKTGELVFDGRGLKWFQIPEEKDSLVCIKTTQHEAFISDSVSKRLYYYGRIARNSQSNRIFDSRGILFEKAFTYVGEFEKGMMSGKGVRVGLDLSYVDGVWKNGQKLHGTLYHLDGRLLESGEYNVNGELEGKECLLRLENNEVYIGEMKSGKPHGSGCQYYLNVSGTATNDYKLKYPADQLQLGAMSLKGSWENGEKDGVFQVYSPEGQLIQEIKYAKGVKVSEGSDTTTNLENETQEREQEGEISLEKRLLVETKVRKNTYYKLTTEEVEKILVGEASPNVVSCYINHISRSNWEAVWQGNIVDPQILILDPEIIKCMREKPMRTAYLQNYTRRFTLPTEKGHNTYLLIFDVFKRIFLPINLDGHWALSEINCEDKNNYKLSIYNLLPANSENPGASVNRKEYLEILSDYLQFEINDKCKDPEIASKYSSRYKKEWATEINLSANPPEKGADYGICYLLLLKLLFEDKEFSELTLEQTNIFTKELYEIARSELESM